MRKTFLTTALTGAGLLCTLGAVQAQVAGSSTPTGISVSAVTLVAMGWSVKEIDLGKTIYNQNGEKVGAVEDLITSPERNLTYAIVGAGGFIGMGGTKSPSPYR